MRISSNINSSSGCGMIHQVRVGFYFRMRYRWPGSHLELQGLLYKFRNVVLLIVLDELVPQQLRVVRTFAVVLIQTVEEGERKQGVSGRKI